MMIKSLQTIRGYAIFLVFISHLSMLSNWGGYEYTSRLGVIGVSLAFILSGFVISYNYYDDEKVTKCPIVFWERRIKKIYPFYVFVLFLAIWIYGVDPSVKEFLTSLFLVQSFVSTKVFYSFHAISWFLSDTVFFYFITPILFFLIKKISRKYFYLGIILLWFLQLALAYIFKDNPNKKWIIYINPLARTLDYIMGCLLAQIYMDKREKNVLLVEKMAEIVLMIALGTITICNKYFPNEYRFAALGAPIAILSIYYFAKPKITILKKVMESQILVLFGNISFEFFLIHPIVITYVVREAASLSPIWQVLLSFGLSVLISAVAYYSREMIDKWQKQMTNAMSNRR